MLNEAINTTVVNEDEYNTLAVAFSVDSQAYEGQLTIWGNGSATILEWDDDTIGGNFDWNPALLNASQDDPTTVNTYESEEITFYIPE